MLLTVILFADNKDKEADKEIAKIKDLKLLIKILREAIVPPVGTKKEDIIKVYGEPDKIYNGAYYCDCKTSKLLDYGKFTTHAYELIKSTSKTSRNGVAMYIRYENKNNTVASTGLRYYSIPGGLSFALPGLEPDKIIFSELATIYNKYYEKLNHASWNCKKPPRNYDKKLIQKSRYNKSIQRTEYRR